MRCKLKCERGTNDCNKNCSADKCVAAGALQIYGGYLRRRGKIVGFRFSQNHKRSVNSTDASLLGIIDTRILISAFLKFLHAILSSLPKFVQIAELNRLRRACFRAGRNEPGLLAVVAECAFKGAPILRSFVDHSERAGHDAVSATVAYIRLHKHRTDFGSDNRSRRTRFK